MGKTPLANRTYQQVRMLNTNEHLPAGEKITEAAVSELLGVFWEPEFQQADFTKNITAKLLRRS